MFINKLKAIGAQDNTAFLASVGGVFDISGAEGLPLRFGLFNLFRTTKKPCDSFVKSPLISFERKKAPQRIPRLTLPRAPTDGGV